MNKTFTFTASFGASFQGIFSLLNIRKLVLLILMSMIVFGQSFGQADVFVRLVVQDNKKIIALVEKEGNDYKQISAIENPKIYDILNSSLSELPYDKALEILNRQKLIGTISEQELERLKTDGLVKRLNAINSEAGDKKYNLELLENNYAGRKSRIPLKYMDETQVYFSIPSTETEFKKIFGENTYTGSQLTKIQTIRQSVLDYENSNIIFSSNSNDILNGIRSGSKNKSIILIGHNNHGKFYFPDGSFLNVNEMDKQARDHDRIIIYLPCNADEFTGNSAADFGLTYSDAIKLTERLNYRIPSDFDRSQKQVRKKIQRRIINDYTKEESLKFRLKVITYNKPTTGIGYGLYQIDKK